MTTTIPEAFVMSFRGPEGGYSISFEPTDEWDGRIDVSIRRREDAVGRCRR